MSRRALVVAAVLLVVPGAACSRGAEADAPAQAASTFAEPVSVDNCGRTVTLDGPPQRIITMNGHVTETLIEMGAGDRIVGKGYAGRIDPQSEAAAEYEKIPSLAEKYPTAEQVRDAEPDFVVGGMSSAFDEKSGLSREDLAGDGIASFLFSEYCGEGFSGIDVLRTDFTQLGRVLDVPDQAQALVDRIVGGLEDIKTRVDASGEEPVPTFFYDSGTDQPVTIGSAGIGNVIAHYAGARNITPDSPKPYFTSSWEMVGERAPEAIVVLDYGDQSAQDKIDFLKSQPVMQTTPAVQNDRFTVVPLDDMFESSRMVRAAGTVARGVHPQAFGEAG